MKKRRSPPPIIQPVKCRGCIWGKWQDTVQICHRSRCVRNEEMAEANTKKNFRSIITSAAKS
ncbi:hypothetical protein BK133_05170 [Paenibacillus sp. FSL H8-0548]|nr:hypothetical protein BK133_05170 [Paenibacillus sp. FSL H8-0548]